MLEINCLLIFTLPFVRFLLLSNIEVDFVSEKRKFQKLTKKGDPNK